MAQLDVPSQTSDKTPKARIADPGTAGPRVAAAVADPRANEEPFVSTAPHEICRRLGETKFKEMFLSLNAAAMKASLAEVGLPAVRLPTHHSLRKRNEDWARRLWQSVESPRGGGCKLLLFEWLRQTKSPMLAAFLDAAGVPHEKGLTDADFMKEVPEEKLLAAAKQLLAHPEFDRRDVASYLLFLDYSNETDKFASLNLEQSLTP